MEIKVPKQPADTTEPAKLFKEFMDKNVRMLSEAVETNAVDVWLKAVAVTFSDGYLAGVNQQYEDARPILQAAERAIVKLQKGLAQCTREREVAITLILDLRDELNGKKKETTCQQNRNST